MVTDYYLHFVLANIELQPKNHKIIVFGIVKLRFMELNLTLLFKFS